MSHIIHRICSVSSLLALVLTGCVSIDSRTWNESVDPEATASISASFSNHAFYRSTGELLAVDNLAELLGIPATDSDSVFVSFKKEGDLTLTFFKNEIASASRTYSAIDGLSLDSDGRINLPITREFVGRDGVLGYQSKSAKLFVNQDGDLATIQSGGGGGTIGIVIPIGIYARHLAIFSRQD